MNLYTTKIQWRWSVLHEVQDRSPRCLRFISWCHIFSVMYFISFWNRKGPSVVLPISTFPEHVFLLLPHLLLLIQVKTIVWLLGEMQDYEFFCLTSLSKDIGTGNFTSSATAISNQCVEDRQQTEGVCATDHPFPAWRRSVLLTLV